MENLVIMFGGCYKDKKILITGATGFKGTWLALWLFRMGAKVYGFSKDIPTSPSHFEALQLSEKIVHRFGDLNNPDDFEFFYKEVNPDYVFHLAAQPLVKKSYEDPIDTFSTNVIGTARVLEAIRKYDNRVMAVMITSDKCYDNVEWEWGYRETDALGGKDPYSASKGGAELVIKSYYHSYLKDREHIRLASTRAGNVIGGGDWAADRLVPDCVKAWSEGSDVEIRSPHSTRPWQHVLEPLSGYLRLGQLLAEKTSLDGEPFNFGPDPASNYTVLELLKSLKHYWGFAEDEKFQINEISRSFHEAGLLKLSCDKALAHLAWQPVLHFSETAEFTASWYRDFYRGDDAAILTFNQIEQYEKLAKERERLWAI